MKTFFSIMLAFGAIAFASSWVPTPEATNEMKHYQRQFTGSVSDAEADTLSVPANLVSIWQYNLTADVTTSDSTESNVIFILEENNERIGGVWYELERDTVTINEAGLAASTRLYGAGGEGTVRGHRQRVRVAGVGTQESAYTVTATYKRVN